MDRAAGKVRPQVGQRIVLGQHERRFQVVKNRKIVAGDLTRHGLALNVDIDLERYTACIVPCGLRDLTVTSLARILTATPPLFEVQQRLLPFLLRALGASQLADTTPTSPFSGALHG